MKDHIHVVWEFLQPLNMKDSINRFRRFTGKKIVAYLKEVGPEYLENFMSERKDRKYKVWKINPDNFHLLHESIVIQKINYVHENPTKGDYQTVEHGELYLHSSAKAYSLGKSNFSFLTLFQG